MKDGMTKDEDQDDRLGKKEGSASRRTRLGREKENDEQGKKERVTVSSRQGRWDERQTGMKGL